MFYQALELKSSPAVHAALARVSKRAMNPQEVLEQRISYVYGLMSKDSTVTREQVREMILKQSGSAEMPA